MRKQQQALKPITTVEGLLEAGLLQEKDLPAVSEAAKDFAIRVTPEVVAGIRRKDASDPLYAQYVPSAAELESDGLEMDDPTGDGPFSPLKGVVHRYPDRVLLKVTHTCEVYCRFCFRKDKVGQGEKGLTAAEIDAALTYIRNDPAIFEVILSGGDPLVLSPRRLSEILKKLASVSHVKVVRIHTRVPVVAPEKINAGLLAALRKFPTVYVAIHVNHVRELSDTAKAALARLVDGGVPLLSQTVLLKGVNNSVEALADLMRALVAVRVKPYYLHHLDRARGTSRFRCSIAEGQRLVRALRGRLSGLCQPTYMLDIPGGHGKVPIGPAFLGGSENGSHVVEDPWGYMHKYVDGV